MVQGALRGKAMVNLAAQLGWKGLSNKVKIVTDSSAAKSFVCRRG